MSGRPMRAGIGATLAAASQYLEQPNLLQHNVLLRISHQRETLQQAFDLLWTPQDDGLVATLSAGFGWNRQHVSGGMRFFGGAGDSVYRALPEDVVAFCAWSVSW